MGNEEVKIMQSGFNMAECIKAFNECQDQLTNLGKALLAANPEGETTIVDKHLDNLFSSMEVLAIGLCCEANSIAGGIFFGTTEDWRIFCEGDTEKVPNPESIEIQKTIQTKAHQTQGNCPPTYGHPIRFRDIVNTLGIAKGFFEPEVDWETQPDGSIKIIPGADITMDTEVTVNYYFYHHMNQDFPREAAQQAIEHGDWETFHEIQKRFECGGSECEGIAYLPREACVAAGDKVVGTLDVTYKPEVFSLITYAESECG